MMDPHILATSITLPPYSEPLPVIMEYVESWMQGRSERDLQKARRIFRNAGVDARYSIMPAQEVFQRESFAKRNDRFMEKMIPLAVANLEALFNHAQLKANQVDYFITTSCTGLMIPSLDAYLVNALGFKGDVIRMPITEMGCAGGTSGLMYARELLANQPGKRAVVLAFESPTSTFQYDDYSFTNIVSAAIFGDGLASALVSTHPDDQRPGVPTLVDSAMYHFFNETRMMGFDLKESGLHIVLDPEVPTTIEKHFPNILPPFLAKHGLSIEEIDHFVFHPGGKKIIQMVEALIEPFGKDMRFTREVLKTYGNMSSATVLFVLHACQQSQPAAGDTGLMLSFGPGFSAQNILLRWT